MIDNIVIPIHTRADERDLRSVSERIHDAITRGAADTGRDWSATFTRTARIDPGKITPNAARFAAQGAKDGKSYAAGFRKEMGNAVSGIGDGIGNALRGVAIAGAAPALLAISSAAVSASGAIGLIPGAAVAAGTAIGTLAMATHGFGDAIKDMGDPKKFAEDLQSLSPAAQQTALSIKNLMPEFKKLQQATQESLFQGFAKQVHDLSNVYLPTVQNATTGIAGAFNGIAMNIAGELMKPATFQAVSGTLDNIVRSFQNLAPAAAPFTSAIAKLAEAGSSFMPRLATEIANAATKFSDFITAAAQSGKLQDWISRGIDALKQIGSIAWDVGRAFVAIGERGAEYLPKIESIVRSIADALREHPGLIDAIAAGFAIWGGAKVLGAIGSVATGIKGIGTALGLLPGQAATAAAGINTALASITIPAAVAAFLFGTTDWDKLRQSNEQHGGPGNARFGPRQGGFTGSNPGYNGGSGTFAPPWTVNSPTPTHGGNGPHGGVGDRYRQKQLDAMMQPPDAGLPPWQPLAVPDIPADAGRGKGKGIEAPVVEYSGDPMSLLQGYPVSSSLYSAAQSVLTARQKVAEDTALVQKLEASNNATADEIQKAKNDLLKDQQDQQEAELRLNEAKAASTKQFAKSTADATKAMDDITSGISFEGGIPGLISGLVKSVMALTFAPLAGQLSAIKQANPGEGSGITGWMAANGVFGDRYRPENINASQGGPQGDYPRYGGPSGYGGNVDRMIGLAQAASGRTAYGPASDLVNGLADCSGSISDLVEVLTTGTSSSARLFTTTNFASDAEAAKQGFYPGYQPGALNVGVNPYPGQSGHMAATLPNGVNFEGGGGTGGGAQYGGSAKGALDPQFEKHYFMPVGPTSYGPSIYSPENTNPALNNPVAPQGGSQYAYAPAGPLPASFPGGPMGGPPTAYTPTLQPQAAPGWKPSGSNGGGGGLLGMASGAASAGLNMLAPGAGALASMGFQVLNRTVRFGGELASELAQGALSSLSVQDPDGGGGTDLSQSWVGRLASSMASAAPALPSTAGKADANMRQPQQQNVDPNSTQHGQGNGQPPGPFIGTLNVQADKATGQQMANEFAYASASAGLR